MKKFISAATMLMIVGLALPAIAADDSTANNKVSIGFYFPANNQGSFSMVGGGDAHGSAEVTSAQVYADPNGNGQRISTTKVLHYAGGDVYMATDGVFVASATTRESSGTWTLTGGTAIYADVSGGGKYHWFRTLSTGILAGAYSGKMKLDGDEGGLATRADRAY